MASGAIRGPIFLPTQCLPIYYRPPRRYYSIGGISMDEELKQQLEIMNANLNTVAQNQAMLYAELKEIEGRLPEQEAEG